MFFLWRHFQKMEGCFTTPPHSSGQISWSFPRNMGHEEGVFLRMFYTLWYFNQPKNNHQSPGGKFYGKQPSAIIFASQARLEATGFSSSKQPLGPWSSASSASTPSPDSPPAGHPARKVSGLGQDTRCLVNVNKKRHRKWPSRNRWFTQL